MKKILLSLVVLATSALVLGAQEPATLTVADGTVANSNVPLNTPWWDTEGTTTQVIYPASMIEDMEGGVISSIKFYTQSSNGFVFVDGIKIQISLGTTDKASYAAAIPIEGLTIVNPELTSPENGLTEVEFVFDTPFTYNGGNLVFECKVIETAGNFKSNAFLGENQETNVSMSRSYVYNFMPKTTFNYQPAVLEDYNAAVSVEELNFGKNIIDTEKVMNVTLKNKGMNAFTPEITGLEAPFSTTYEAAELASRESVTIPVKFAPTDFGEYTGTMTINCGQAGALTVALSGNCPNELALTVCDGDNKSEYAPIYGFYCDSKGTFTQMLYPAEMLADVAGNKIIGVKFYPDAALAVGTPTMELSFKPTEETAFEVASSIAIPSNLVTELTTVASTTLAGGEAELAFELEEPYTYEGGNLAIQVLVAEKGGWHRTYFYGETQETNTAYAQWGGSGYNMTLQFLPKMTLIYQKEETPVEETITVTGTVKDEEEMPIEGVNVVLTVNAPTTDGMREATTYTTTTDAEGVYTMDVTPVEGATYDIVFSKDGYVTKTLENVDLENVPEVVVLEEDFPQAITDINAGNVVSVQYIDAMGRVSDRPFKGVNIVVARNADGTTSTTKVVK